MIDLKAKLSGMTHQTDELAKENANLKPEMAALHEHMDKVKEEAIKEYQMSQPYFNQNGGLLWGRLQGLSQASCPHVPKIGHLLDPD